MRSGWWILPSAVIGAMMWASVLFAGTWDEVKRFDAGCAYIPPNTACLSACATAFLKAPHRKNDGIMGLHRFYTLDGKANPYITIVVHPTLRVYMEQAGIGQYYRTVMDKTDPSTFLLFQGDKVWLQEWQELKGYKVSSSPKSLRKCEVR